MGDVVVGNFKAKLKKVREDDETFMPLPDDDAIELFAHILLYIRELSTSATAEIKISDDSLILKVTHHTDSESGEFGVDAGTQMVRTAIADIVDDDGEPFEGEDLRDIVKEMFTKVQI